MREPWMIAAGCVLIAALAGCGINAEGNAAEQSRIASSTTTAEHSTSEEYEFGREHLFANGLSITVSKPQSFKPSSTADPRVERALAFVITIANGTDRRYRLSGVSVTVSADGEPCREVIDSTQGFNGNIDAGRDLPVAKRVRMTLAFAAKKEPSAVRLEVRPDPNSPATARYVGRG